MDVALSIGETFSPCFCSPCTVVGIDHYSMRSFNGQRVTWDSYTLTSASPAPFDRWWLVNTPGTGAQIFTATNGIPAAARFRPDLSGLVMIRSEGNADLSSETGALAVYEEAGFLYAEEVFSDAERIMFKGKPYSAS